MVEIFGTIWSIYWHYCWPTTSVCRATLTTSAAMTSSLLMPRTCPTRLMSRSMRRKLPPARPCSTQFCLDHRAVRWLHKAARPSSTSIGYWRDFSAIDENDPMTDRLTDLYATLSDPPPRFSAQTDGPGAASASQRNGPRRRVQPRAPLAAGLPRPSGAQRRKLAQSCRIPVTAYVTRTSPVTSSAVRRIDPPAPARSDAPKIGVTGERRAPVTAAVIYPRADQAAHRDHRACGTDGRRAGPLG